MGGFNFGSTIVLIFEAPNDFEFVVKPGGKMSITGSPETKPYRVGYPIADTSGGMAAAMSIAAALNAEPRGAFLDVSMSDAVLSAMGWVGAGRRNLHAIRHLEYRGDQQQADGNLQHAGVIRVDQYDLFTKQQCQNRRAGHECRAKKNARLCS